MYTARMHSGCDHFTPRRLAHIALAGTTAALPAKAQRVPAITTSTADATGLTRRCADFIVQTLYRDVPPDVIVLVESARKLEQIPHVRTTTALYQRIEKRAEP